MLEDVVVDSNDWLELDTYTTKKFIEDVRDEEFAGLFNCPAYELWKRNLRFFDGYDHYILNNKYVFPYFSLHYISNGQEHYFLDGSEHCLELLVRKGCFRLNERNLLDYLQFHSDATFYPYRKVKFITNPEDAPYSGASAMRHHFNALSFHSVSSLKECDEGECFYVDMPVLYNGETVKGHVQVMKTGEINVLTPVNVPLMDGKREHKALDYDHPHEKELLQQNIDILRQSEEGKRLFDTMKSYNAQLRFVSGVGSNGFALNSLQGFVVAPENLDTYSPYQVIAIAGVLRDMELKCLDQHRPDPFDDPEKVLEQHINLNLDILETICTIGEELEHSGFSEVLEKFKKLGFEEFFSAFKNGANRKELAQVFVKYLRMEIEVL